MQYTHGQAQMCSQNLRNKDVEYIQCDLQHNYVNVHKMCATFTLKLSTDTPSHNTF